MGRYCLALKLPLYKLFTETVTASSCFFLEQWLKKNFCKIPGSKNSVQFFFAICYDLFGFLWNFILSSSSGASSTFFWRALNADYGSFVSRMPCQCVLWCCCSDVPCVLPRHVQEEELHSGCLCHLLYLHLYQLVIQSNNIHLSHPIMHQFVSGFGVQLGQLSL